MNPKPPDHVEPDATPWDYALLTGTASIQHSLRCGAEMASALGEPRPGWESASSHMAAMIGEHPDEFEPKDRWAMDWYYPVLTGAMVGEEAKARLADGWSTFAMEGRGIRHSKRTPGSVFLNFQSISSTAARELSSSP